MLRETELAEGANLYNISVFAVLIVYCAYSTVALMLYRLASVVCCTECIVAKWCVLEQQEAKLSLG